jgi:hypothetical protein
LIRTLKLLAIGFTMLLPIMVFYGIFKNIFNTPGFLLLYLLILGADFLIITVIKKYNDQRKC